ncbi:MFS transporter [Streptomyces barringtoniae]|uniref:MFS transporter n=1 Tax=Streptomyces barringtoniae TaxID=2892029 RepID=UPI001E5BF364|nr:MFS transporter [Streptomyces barringtoniae]MCC5478348.1 MFS transporter [Streptomyces barringtoniae]
MPTVGRRTNVTTLPIILGLALAFTVTVVDPLVLSLNLPQVSRALHAPPHVLGLLSGAATLVMAVAVLAAGRLGDVFGLKRLLMRGLVVVTVVDLISMLSPGYGFLLVMRLLAGLGMTALLGVPLALVKVAVPPEKRPVGIGILMAVTTILCGVVPAFTGWMVAAVGWRFLFLIGPLMCLVSLWLTARYVPESPVQRGRRLDMGGVTMIGTALLALVVGLAAAQNGISRPETWVPLVISAVGAVLFALHERRTAEPALDLVLFRSTPFSVALAATLTLNFLAAGLGLVLGQFGSIVLSLSPETIGLLYLPGTLLIAGAVILAGRLVGKYTPRPVMVTGLLVMAASGLLLAGTAGPTMALWLLVLATWLCNLGSLVTSTSVSETVLSQAPPGHSGTVASVQMAFAMTGSAFGPTVYLLLFDFFFQRRWLADAKARDLSVRKAEQAVDAVRSGMAQHPGGNGYDPNLLRQAAGLKLGLDFAEGLRLAMLTVSILPLAVAALAFVLMPRCKEARA